MPYFRVTLFGIDYADSWAAGPSRDRIAWRDAGSFPNSPRVGMNCRSTRDSDMRTYPEVLRFSTAVYSRQRRRVGHWMRVCKTLATISA